IIFIGGTSTARAHGIYPHHKHISNLPPKVQIEIYQHNIQHARYTIRWWRSSDGNWAFNAKQFPKANRIAKVDLAFHRRLLSNATRHLHTLWWVLTRREIPHYNQWLCIHNYEGSWTDPNPPYF